MTLLYKISVIHASSLCTCIHIKPFFSIFFCFFLMSLLCLTDYDIHKMISIRIVLEAYSGLYQHFPILTFAIEMMVQRIGFSSLNFHSWGFGTRSKIFLSPLNNYLKRELITFISYYNYLSDMKDRNDANPTNACI